MEPLGCAVAVVGRLRHPKPVCPAEDPLSKRDKIRSILNEQPRSVQNNALCFIEGGCLPKKTAGAGLLASLQDLVKRNGRIYYFVVDVISPVKTARKFRRLLRALLDKYTAEHVILNYGSGPRTMHGRT